MNPRVDAFIRYAKQWQAEYAKLREIILPFGLTEDIKWMHPCYSYEKRNVVLIHGFKEYCALLFFQGALLDDPHGLLVQQTKNVQAGRQIRFTGFAEIVAQEAVLQEYLRNAIAVEKAGQKVVLKKTSEFTVVDEFQAALDASPALKQAFDGLTPGRQRAYLLYFSAAKQTKTRLARIEKCTPRILDGLGLDD
ncbi:MAG: YdeI/OmpD-associated family protein [bacterium]|nr:YdeI/OmpD-associated family protein [bacterium]